MRLLLITILLISGCATGKGVEITEYCASYHTYQGKVALQGARGTLRDINGFHIAKGKDYEVHSVKWDFCTLGHEVMHGLVKEGLDAEGHPHFK